MAIEEDIYNALVNADSATGPEIYNQTDAVVIDSDFNSIGNWQQYESGVAVVDNVDFYNGLYCIKASNLKSVVSAVVFPIPTYLTLESGKTYKLEVAAKHDGVSLGNGVIATGANEEDTSNYFATLTPANNTYALYSTDIMFTGSQVFAIFKGASGVPATMFFDSFSIKKYLDIVAGGRIYFGKMPRNPVYPCVVFHRVSTNTNSTLSGDHVNKESAFFQFDVYAKTTAEKTTTVNQLRAAMNAASFKNRCLDQQNLNFDNSVDIHRDSLDFIVWYDYVL